MRPLDGRTARAASLWTGSGLRLVVPWGRTRRSPEFRRSALRRVPYVGLARHPSRPKAVANRKRPFTEKVSAGRRAAPTPGLRPPARWGRSRRASRSPRGTEAESRCSRVSKHHPAAEDRTRARTKWGRDPFAGRTAAAISLSGLRLVVPWGRPRAPLPPALGAESLFLELPGAPHRHLECKWDAALEGQDSAGRRASGRGRDCAW